jgi:hypothetical protein
MVMMSRKGPLPEADFYRPVLYKPLGICTPEAIEEPIDQACDTFLPRSKVVRANGKARTVLRTCRST